MVARWRASSRAHAARATVCDSRPPLADRNDGPTAFALPLLRYKSRELLAPRPDDRLPVREEEMVELELVEQAPVRGA